MLPCYTTQQVCGNNSCNITLSFPCIPRGRLTHLKHSSEEPSQKREQSARLTQQQDAGWGTNQELPSRQQCTESKARVAQQGGPMGGVYALASLPVLSQALE
jgi:hypothetical protein